MGGWAKQQTQLRGWLPAGQRRRRRRAADRRRCRPFLNGRPSVRPSVRPPSAAWSKLYITTCVRPDRRRRARRGRRRQQQCRRRRRQQQRGQGELRRRQLLLVKAKRQRCGGKEEEEGAWVGRGDHDRGECEWQRLGDGFRHKPYLDQCMKMAF